MRTIGLIGIAIVAAMLAPTRAYAQASEQAPPPQTREEQLRQARQAKAESVAPPAKSSVERFLDYIEDSNVIQRVLLGWKGIQLHGGGFPARSGPSIGLGFGDQAIGSYYVNPSEHDRIDVDTQAVISTRGYQRAHLAVAWRNMRGSRFDLELRTGYTRYPQQDFFGIGANTSVDDRTDYSAIHRRVDGTLLWGFAESVTLLAGVGFDSPSIRAGTDDDQPAIEDMFARGSVPGLGRQPDHLALRAGFHVDTRDRDIVPRHGGVYRGSIARYLDLDSAGFAFRKVELEVQQYLPLPGPRRVLAVRGLLAVASAGDGEQVPFYSMPRLGGALHLRGYEDSRFTDRGALLLTAEYRWPAWNNGPEVLDAAVFVDTGTVFPELGSVALSDFALGYGVGVRLRSRYGTLLRIDLAASREGFFPLVRFDQVF